MAKLELSSGVVTPTPPSAAPQDPVEKLLTGWYRELEEMQYVTTAQYEVEGLQNLYNDKIKLQALLSRTDTLMAKGHRLYRKVQNALIASKDLLDDEIDKLKAHPERLIAKAYAYQEREACYRSSPSLIAARMQIRVLERQVSDCETFVKVVVHKYRHFENLRQDQLSQISLIRLGFTFREVELSESNSR